MKSSLYEQKRKNGVNIGAQASYSGLIRVSGGFGLSKQQHEEASEFSKSVETKTITVGAAPPSNGDAMTWAATVQNNPVPSHYKLEPIESLFREDYMNKFSVDYQKISINLNILKVQYYQKLEAENEYRRTKDSIKRCCLSKMLTVENGGTYGSWQGAEFCPIGSFATGFNMKYDGKQSSNADSTGLNGVRLICANRVGIPMTNHKLVKSVSGHRGSWTGDTYCPKGHGVANFLQSFELMVQHPGQSDDNTMANAVRFTCRDSNWTHQKKVNMEKPAKSVQLVRQYVDLRHAWKGMTRKVTILL